VASTRQPSRPIAAATAWRSTMAFTPMERSTSTVVVGGQGAATGTPAPVRGLHDGCPHLPLKSDGMCKMPTIAN
jgi:hypothetical protein